MPEELNELDEAFIAIDVAGHMATLVFGEKFDPDRQKVLFDGIQKKLIGSGEYSPAQVEQVVSQYRKAAGGVWAMFQASERKG